MYAADSSHWNPESNAFPFYEDGHLLGEHAVYLHRIYMRDKRFIELFRGVCGVTRNSPDKAWVMYQLTQAVQHLPGAVAEVGAYRGGTAKLLAEFFLGRSLHVYDTFEGIPNLLSEHDNPKIAGEYPADYESVVNFIGHSERVSVHKGIFPKTFDLWKERFIFVHLDVDTYVTTRVGLELFYDLMVPGGVIVMDDYHTNYKGVDDAIEEFAADRDLSVLQFAMSQALIIKG